jgi:polyphosphate kinase 2 (PPK2 family)
MGFCTDDQAKRFLDEVPNVEKAIIDSGIVLLKYWLEVSPGEQTKRLTERIDDGRKIWKLSPMDLKSYTRWDDYTEARDDMFRASDTSWAPWHVARSDDKRRARLNVITHILRSVPYKDVSQDKVKLPKRHVKKTGDRPQYPLRFIPEAY